MFWFSQKNISTNPMYFYVSFWKIFLSSSSTKIKHLLPEESQLLLLLFISSSREETLFIIITLLWGFYCCINIFKKDPTKIKNKNCIKYHRTTRTKNIFLLLPPLPLLPHLPLLPPLLSTFFFFFLLLLSNPNKPRMSKNLLLDFS